MNLITEYFSGNVYCINCKEKFIQYALQCSNCKCNKPINVYDSIMLFLKSKLPHIDIFQNDTQIFTDYKTDIVIPDYNLAIEILNKSISDNSNYNLYKKIKINSNGYRYIQIFEDEWINKRNIIEAYLLHNIGVYDDVHEITKCKIKLINKKARTKFLISNHVLGDINSPISFGSYYKNKLVSVLCGRIVGNKFIITRFSIIKNNKFDGIVKKFISYIIEMLVVNEIEVTIDLRFESGETFKKANFSNTEIIKPTHWFINKFDIMDRRSKTPTNKQSNYICIWDCGKIKMLFKKGL